MITADEIKRIWGSKPRRIDQRNRIHILCYDEEGCFAFKALWTFTDVTTADELRAYMHKYGITPMDERWSFDRDFLVACCVGATVGCIPMAVYLAWRLIKGDK